MSMQIETAHHKTPADEFQRLAFVPVGVFAKAVNKKNSASRGCALRVEPVINGNFFTALASNFLLVGAHKKALKDCKSGELARIISASCVLCALLQ